MLIMLVPFPELGESVLEGTLGRWLVQPGEWVNKDQKLVTVETSKINCEVFSPFAGVVTRIHGSEGDVIPAGSGLVEINIEATAPEVKHAVATPTPAAPEPLSSPVVRKTAREEGIPLHTVQGSGPRGRVTTEDVRSAASTAQAPKVQDSREQLPLQRVPTLSRSAFIPPAYKPSPGDETVPFSRRRRIIADHMVYSKHVAPHVYTFAEIDMHRVAKLREARKDALKAEGVNLTFLAFVAAATAQALREHPVLNSRVLEDAFVKIRQVNLGVAVETPEGLIVPVVKRADELTVKGLARSIGEVADKARTGKIEMEDVTGSTFTISNPGTKGNFVGAAVISQPNVGILRLGEITKRPVVVEVDGADSIVIHPVMFVALSYDHRIVDGVAANAFLYRITELLEAGDFQV